MSGLDKSHDPFLKDELSMQKDRKREKERVIRDMNMIMLDYSAMSKCLILSYVTMYYNNILN